MAAPSEARIVLPDANVLSNLIHVDRLGLLGALPGYEFAVPPEVEAEVSVPEEAETLARGFQAGHIDRVSFSSTDELELYAELVQTLGRGEAACLAIAQVRGWYVASDERRRFLRLARERIGRGRILNTAGIFVLAIGAGLVTVAEADRDKRVLEGYRFEMRFSSFREVLGTHSRR